LVFVAAQGLQGLQGLQGFFAAHGLHGLHGLQALTFFAAQGLHGLHAFLAAHCAICTTPGPSGPAAAAGRAMLAPAPPRAATPIAATVFLNMGIALLCSISQPGFTGPFSFLVPCLARCIPERESTSLTVFHDAVSGIGTRARGAARTVLANS